MCAKDKTCLLWGGEGAAQYLKIFSFFYWSRTCWVQFSKNTFPVVNLFAMHFHICKNPQYFCCGRIFSPYSHLCFSCKSNMSWGIIKFISLSSLFALYFHICKKRHHLFWGAESIFTQSVYVRLLNFVRLVNLKLTEKLHRFVLYPF